MELILMLVALILFVLLIPTRLDPAIRLKEFNEARIAKKEAEAFRKAKERK